jgi:hypothetical protein
LHEIGLLMIADSKLEGLSPLQCAVNSSIFTVCSTVDSKPKNTSRFTQTHSMDYELFTSTASSHYPLKKETQLVTDEELIKAHNAPNNLLLKEFEIAIKRMVKSTMPE